ncbi:MAG: hypothetical protein AAF802_31885, partial [Planctomycetota bacterium]
MAGNSSRNLVQALGVLTFIFVSAKVTPAVAGDQLELRPPLNSTLTIRKAKTNWEPRVTAPELVPNANGSETAQAPAQVTAPPKTDGSTTPAEETRKSESGTPAIVASSPLDRFRKPSLPDRPARINGTPTGDAQQDSNESLPRLPGSAAWQTRGAADRGLSLSPPISPNAQAERAPATALPPATKLPAIGGEQIAPQATQPIRRQQVTSPRPVQDMFRGPIEEGTWVARDAVNRIEPLVDPISPSQQPSGSPPQQSLDAPSGDTQSSSSSFQPRQTMESERDKSTTIPRANETRSMTLGLGSDAEEQPRPTQPNETATDDGAAITSKQELAAKEPAVAKKSEDGQWAERMLK